MKCRMVGMVVAVWIATHATSAFAAEIVEDEATLDKIRTVNFDVLGVSYTAGNWTAHIPPSRALPDCDKAKSLSEQRYGSSSATVSYCDLNRVMIAKEGDEILAAAFFGITDAKPGGSRPSSLWVDSIYFSHNQRSIEGFKDVIATLVGLYGSTRRLEIDLKRMALSLQLRDFLRLPRPDSTVLTTCQSEVEGEVFGNYVASIIKEAVPKIMIGRVSNTNGYNWGVILRHDGPQFTTTIPKVRRTLYNTCVEPIIDAFMYWLP